VGWTDQEFEDFRAKSKLFASAKPPKRGHRSKEKETLGRYLMTHGTTWALEHRFHPVRLWRFDWAITSLKIAVEFEGGVFIPKGGGHTKGMDYSKDCEKYSEAAILGWLVVRCTAPMIRSGLAFDLIERAIKARQK